MPIFEINVNEKNISIRYEYLMKESGGNCIFGVPIALINRTGPLSFNAEDLLILGSDYFKDL
jgi:hypothetical protein